MTVERLHALSAKLVKALLNNPTAFKIVEVSSNSTDQVVLLCRASARYGLKATLPELIFVQKSSKRLRNYLYIQGFS